MKTFLSRADINRIRKKKGLRPITKNYAVVDGRDKVLKTFNKISNVRKYLKKR